MQVIVVARCQLLGGAIDLEGSADARRVDDQHVLQGGVTGVGHHIGPGDRIAERDQRAEAVVGIHPVGRLLDFDGGSGISEIDDPASDDCFRRDGDGEPTGRVELVQRECRIAAVRSPEGASGLIGTLE